MNKSLFVFLLLAALAISAFAEEDCRDRLARREAEAKDSQKKTNDLLDAANARSTTLAGTLKDKQNKLASDFPKDLIDTNLVDIAGYREEIARHEERLKVVGLSKSAKDRATRSLAEAKLSLQELLDEMVRFEALKAEISDVEGQIAGNNQVIVALKKQLALIATILADIARLKVICEENCDKAQGDYLTALQKEAADLNSAIANRDELKDKVAALQTAIVGLDNQINAQNNDINNKNTRCAAHKTAGDQMNQKIANEIALCELLIEKSEAINSSGDKNNIITILQGLIDKLKKSNPYGAWKSCLAEVQELTKVRDAYTQQKATKTVEKNGAVNELAVAEALVLTEQKSVREAQEALDAAANKCKTIKMMQAQTESVDTQTQTNTFDVSNMLSGIETLSVENTGAKVESTDYSVGQSISQDVESTLSHVSNNQFAEPANTQATVESFKPATAVNIQDYTVPQHEDSQQMDYAVVDTFEY